ncbi:MAG: hypothetical protein KC425_19580, partial [Anaerolineales bacterium]|nr:hypothetical protein [Anaerolineales bacterium]
MIRLWKVMRPQVWQLDRRLRAANRLLVVLAVLLLGVGGQWLWNGPVQRGMALLATETAVALVAPLLATGLLLFLFIGMVGIGDVMRLLFQAPDLERLLVAPLPARTVFGVKLLQCSRVMLLPAILLGLFLGLFGAARGAAGLFYGLALLLILGGMLLVTAVLMGVVLLLARFLPAQRVRAWLPAATSLLAVVLVLGQQGLTNWFLQQTALLAGLTTALLQPAPLARLALGVGGAALLAAGGAYWLFDRAFFEGWQRLQVVTMPAARPRAVGGATRWLRLFPGEIRPFVRAEWLLLRRDTTRLVGLGVAALPALLMLAPLLGSARTAALRPLLFWLLLAIGLTTTLVGLSGETLPAVGREGVRREVWRAAPVAARTVLAGKFWGNGWLPLLLLWLVLLAVLGAVLGLAAWQVVVVETAVVWQVTLGAALVFALGAVMADFTADDPRKSVRGSVSLLAMLLY